MTKFLKYIKVVYKKFSQLLKHLRHWKLKRTQFMEATNGWLHPWTHPAFRYQTQCIGKVIAHSNLCRQETACKFGCSTPSYFILQWMSCDRSSHNYYHMNEKIFLCTTTTIIYHNFDVMIFCDIQLFKTCEYLYLCIHRRVIKIFAHDNW